MNIKTATIDLWPENESIYAIISDTKDKIYPREELSLNNSLENSFSLLGEALLENGVKQVTIKAFIEDSRAGILRSHLRSFDIIVKLKMTEKRGE